MIEIHKDELYWELMRRRPQRVLELGPCHGRDTEVLASVAGHVIAIEARAENLSAVRERLERRSTRNVSLVEANLETYDLAPLGRFDCVWACGILYHLMRPWELIARIRAVTNCCLGWTHVADVATDEQHGRRVWRYPEDTSRFAGVSPESLWLEPDDFSACWRPWSFRWLSPLDYHPHGGKAAQFIACAS